MLEPFGQVKGGGPAIKAAYRRTRLQLDGAVEVGPGIGEPLLGAGSVVQQRELQLNDGTRQDRRDPVRSDFEHPIHIIQGGLQVGTGISTAMQSNFGELDQRMGPVEHHSVAGPAMVEN